VLGPNLARGYSARLDGLPHAVGRKARWATAWRPARSGAFAVGLVVASRRQGVARELVETTQRAPGKEGAGGAHRGGGATMARCGGVLTGGRVSGYSG
jgi:hypothetical protein